MLKNKKIRKNKKIFHFLQHDSIPIFNTYHILFSYIEMAYIILFRLFNKNKLLKIYIHK